MLTLLCSVTSAFIWYIYCIRSKVSHGKFPNKSKVRFVLSSQFTMLENIGNNRKLTTVLFVLGFSLSVAYIYPRFAHRFKLTSSSNKNSSSASTMSTEGMTEQTLRLQHPGTCTGDLVDKSMCIHNIIDLFIRNVLERRSFHWCGCSIQ